MVELGSRKEAPNFSKTPSLKKITGKKGGKGGRKGKHSKGQRFNVRTLKNPKQSRIDNLLQQDGIFQTYFAAEGGGLKEGYIFEGYEGREGQFTNGFYSQQFLQKQLWREKEPGSQGVKGPLGEAGPEYKGKVPFEVLMNKLNEVLNINDDGTDFRDAFSYWNYRYEVSYSVKTDTGLYNVVIESFGDESDTKPPNFGYEKFVKE